MAPGFGNFATADDASTSSGYQDQGPLARLLSKLRQFKALAADKDLANSELAPLIRALPLDTVRTCRKRSSAGFA